MYTYKIIQGAKIIIRHDGDSVSSFAENPANTDYQAYLKWVSEGNTPTPADEGTQ
jgi:hypothetical protein